MELPLLETRGKRQEREEKGREGEREARVLGFVIVCHRFVRCGTASAPTERTQRQLENGSRYHEPMTSTCTNRGGNRGTRQSGEKRGTRFGVRGTPRAAWNCLCSQREARYRRFQFMRERGKQKGMPFWDSGDSLRRMELPLLPKPRKVKAYE